MNGASWRRHAAFLVAVLLHIGVLWLVLPYLIDQSEPPPSDSVEVAIVPPPAQPPKPVRAAPAERPAETNSSAGRPSFQPRLPRVIRPQLALTVPESILPNPPMSLPAAASGPSSAGLPGNGLGGNGNGAGYGSQEGNDYLVRLKAYIDAHKNGERHLEPNDAELVLVLDRDGNLMGIHVASSSGEPEVDDEIVAELREMSPFPRPPTVLFSPSKPLLSVMDEWIFPRP